MRASQQVLIYLTFLLLVVSIAPAHSDPRTLVITDALQLGLAEAFMAEEEYYRAITEYKKFLYFFPDSEQNVYVQLQIGMAYYHGDECPQAIEAFAKVRQHVRSEHFPPAAYYEGVCRSRLNDPQAAQTNFERVLAYDPTTRQAADALTGIALASLDRQDWAGSRTALRQLITDIPDSPRAGETQEVLDLLDEAENQPRKSPVLAGTMSAILPGSGHAYAGRYRDGLMAFLTNGLFIAGTAVAIDHENYPVAVLIGGAGLPFYLGNIYGSANAAHKWNLSIAQNLRKELSVRLEYRY